MTPTQTPRQLLHSLLWRGRWQRSIEVLLWLLVCLAIIALLVKLNGTPISLAACAGLAIIPLVLAIVWLRYRLRAYHSTNLCWQLNQAVPALQHSSQLWLQTDNELNRIQQAQLAYLDQQLQQPEVQQAIRQALPGFRWPTPTLVLLLVCAVLLWIPGWFTTEPVTETYPDGTLTTTHSAPLLTGQRLLIQPPLYTGIKPFEQSNLAGHLLQGSQLQWQLTFDQPNYRYFIQFDNGLMVNLEKHNKQWQSTAYQLQENHLYRIGWRYQQQHGLLDGVYSLSVQRDKPPQIQLIAPAKRVIEVNSLPTLFIDATVSDDFAVSDIHLQASIAKGSGEAVKFRDQQFALDNKTPLTSKTGQRLQVSKRWDLSQLGMEPGDELYFTVVATDNHQPKPQQTRSTTMILRWLEATQTPQAIQGLSIPPLVEYFRSQRQIIIDTEQLIAAKPDLSDKQLMAQSRDIGFSQQDLKLRYGRFLGDEQISAQPEHDDHDTANTAEQAHAHVSEPGADLEPDEKPMTDKSGASQVLHRFGHNHGEADIGPLAKQDPKTLMKRSVENMWEAELHLMLAQPEQALPYEQQAYRFLKLARQAERIYVQRLGFEPPPISEKRRYSGELTDIHSRTTQHSFTVTANQQQQQLLRWSLQRLQQVRQQQRHQFTEQDGKQFTALQQTLLEMATQQPAALPLAATVQRIITSKQFQPANCPQCLQLFNQLWKLTPSSSIPIIKSEHSLYKSDPVTNDYLRRLSTEEQP